MNTEDELKKLTLSVQELCKAFDLTYKIINPNDKKKNQEKTNIRHEFYDAPLDSLFNDKTISIIVGCSIKTLQQSRWIGGGIPYIKIQGRILYKKSDVLKYIEMEGSKNE
jgi:hypothetical protein